MSMILTVIIAGVLVLGYFLLRKRGSPKSGGKGFHFNLFLPKEPTTDELEDRITKENEEVVRLRELLVEKKKLMLARADAIKLRRQIADVTPQSAAAEAEKEAKAKK